MFSPTIALYIYIYIDNTYIYLCIYISIIHTSVIVWHISRLQYHIVPDNMIHGANMRSTWVLSAPGGSHVNPMNIAIKCLISQIPKFIGPTWGPYESCRPKTGLMFAPWTLLSGILLFIMYFSKKGYHQPFSTCRSRVFELHEMGSVSTRWPHRYFNESLDK